MGLATLGGPTREDSRSSVPTATGTVTPTATTLYDLLHNFVVLRHIVPYLPISGLLHLAALNREFRELILRTPGVFRHLDLTPPAKCLQAECWRGQQDQGITEDEFYGGPLRHGFSHLRRLGVLQQVQTLILDGLCVTAELCHEIINDPASNVRILSIRGVRGLNDRKLVQTLRYACRPSRPKGSPKLEALYVFGARGRPRSGAPADNPGEAWWDVKGHIISGDEPVPKHWANCILACEGIIAFDAVLCRGPRHYNSPIFDMDSSRPDSSPSVAVFGLSPCDGCGDAPEGLICSDSGFHYTRPLLSPPPLFSSSSRGATRPKTRNCSMLGRCLDCLRERSCKLCVKWWCESCYQIPGRSTAGGAHSPEWQSLYDLLALAEVDLSSDASSPSFKVRAGYCQPCGAIAARNLKRAANLEGLEPREFLDGFDFR